jgi:hypothetical protein
MDGYVLTIWVVRVLFLALLYVFLFGVARTLIRDLRAAAREPDRARPARRPRLAGGEPTRARASASTRSRRSAAT